MYETLSNLVSEFKVTSQTPIDDLMTFGRICADAGEYPSTNLDRESRKIAKQCETKLAKVISELKRRKIADSIEDLYKFPDWRNLISNFGKMSISELEHLYIKCSRIRKERSATGFETFTYYIEGHIVDELSKREVSTSSEGVKNKYCSTCYSNELKNLSQVLGLSIGSSEDSLYLDSHHDYSSTELIVLLNKYKEYKTVLEREALIEVIDYSIYAIHDTRGKQTWASLVAEIVELNRKGKARSLEWLKTFLEDAFKEWRKMPSVSDTEMVLPLLTAAINSSNESYRRIAQRIINRCYKACIESNISDADLLEKLYTAVVYSTYVTRYNARKIADIWNDYLSNQANSTSDTKIENIKNQTSIDLHRSAIISN